MGGSEWEFLLDENVGRELEAELERMGYRVEHVVDVLGPGAQDHPDVLPHAQRNDLVVVTKDYSDFGSLQPGEHEGVVLIANHRHTAQEMAGAIENIVVAYGSRDSFRNTREYLGEWVP